jgi:hypothetical protein
MIAPGDTNELLPPLYAAWVGDLLPGGIPRESRATCDDCAMCAHGEEQQRAPEDYFDPTLKCCSYIPHLYNFLVGRILSDNDPAAAPGRTTVEKRIKQGVGVTPIGLDRPPVFNLIYEHSENAFGRSRNLRCPHYLEDTGRCGVWRHRESTCATWFCKHVRGSVGYTFWRTSLHKLLMAVESELSEWCVLELDPDNDALRHLLASESRSRADPITGESIDNKVDQNEYDRVWGQWLGREREFFIECGRLVNALSWNDVLTISGSDVRAYARLTKDAYRHLISDEIPPALKVGGMQLVRITRDMTRISTYNAFDPIDVPSAVMELLHYFDGRSTDEAIEAIQNERDLKLDSSLVRKLVDFELLIPRKQSDLPQDNPS